MNLQQQFQSGYALHQAGRLMEAEKIYRQVLVRRPNHADALHLLGLLSAQSGRIEAAADLLQRAVRANPNSAEAFGNLGNIYKDLRRLDEAIDSYQQAIRLKFDLAEAYSNLGNVLKSQGDSMRQSLRIGRPSSSGPISPRRTAISFMTSIFTPGTTRRCFLMNIDAGTSSTPGGLDNSLFPMPTIATPIVH